MTRIAIIGDVHGRWADEDVSWFNQSDYDHILFVGDLAGSRHSGVLKIVARIARLTTPTLLMPGNHDAIHLLQMGAEIAGTPGLGRPFVRGNHRKLDEIVAALSPHTLAAWSLHPIDQDTAIVAGRPHSFGGPGFSFADFLSERWGIATLDQSIDRMRALIDQAPERILFLGHNGPAGLGAGRADIWGCDFKREGGDWGDRDLRAAIDYARDSGRTVLAVAAGHMHHDLKGGGQRPWTVTDDIGTIHVNAAQVPRIRDRKHHHVRMIIDGDAVSVETVQVAR
ncbi:MAG: metallophosphoesterase [Myxococcota bacterium]